MKPSFVLKDTTPPPMKPVPYRQTIEIPDIYPKFEVEFHDVIKSCAQYIDKINCLETRVKYNKDLSKIFVLRDRGLAMRLFRELINNFFQTKGGHHGKS